MGGTRIMHGKDQKFVRNIGPKIWKEKKPLEKSV
jgi:hypothetical protein